MLDLSFSINDKMSLKIYDFLNKSDAIMSMKKPQGQGTITLQVYLNSINLFHVRTYVSNMGKKMSMQNFFTKY